MQKKSDQELISRSKRGDKEAFGEIVNRYYEKVYGVCYGVVNEREAARDCAQDTFLKAYRMISKFEGRSKITTWLHRIGVNTSIDYLRRKHPQIPVDTIGLSEDEDAEVKSWRLEDFSPGPRDLAHISELKSLIEKALQELTPEHRAVLLLREWQGLSYEEIAESLGVEMGTVMSRIFYARKKLGEVLSPSLEKGKL